MDWYSGRDTLGPADRQRVRKLQMAEAKEFVDDYNIEPGDDEEIEANLDNVHKELGSLRRKLEAIEREIAQAEKSFMKKGLKDLLREHEELIKSHDQAVAEIDAWQNKGVEIGAKLRRRY